MVSVPDVELCEPTNGVFFVGLHELDPVFQKFTMENEKLRQLARDVAFHQDPEGEARTWFYSIFWLNASSILSLAEHGHLQATRDWRQSPRTQ